MKVSGTIREILNNKTNEVCTVAPSTLVYDAIELMANKNIGALPVISRKRLVGMISERDYTRKVVLKGKSSKETPVRDIMSKDVTTVTPDHSISDCMERMTKERIRHLPVIQDNKLVGIISIGDVVNWVISAQDSVLSQMEHYITGGFV